jgi:glyoxylase-like metal-dependent hydrolase (beta-lactamase superfamily II)
MCVANGTKFRVAGMDCVRLTDGQLPYPPAVLFANADPEELARALADELDDAGTLPGPLHPLLIRGSDAVVLVDTGFGRFAPAPGAGRLLTALEHEGVAASNVDIVVLTHAHPDHLGGLIADGKPVFERARHFILEIEWAFWTTAEARAVPEPIATAVEEALVPLHALGVLELGEDGAEVAEGVRLVAAPGHTPGHAIVELGSPCAAIFLADAVLHEAGFAHPEWTSAIDAAPELAVRTRRALLDRAVDERLVVTAYHVRRQGRVERAGGAFRLVAGEP